MQKLKPPILLVSPHFDDAVLSCGYLLHAEPSCHVVTVMAGAPPLPRLTGWNYTTTHEEYAPAALTKRQKEDRAALAAVGASQHLLPFWDGEYNQSPSPSDVADAIIRLARKIDAQSVLLPLGINHPDHVMVGDAVIDVNHAAVADVWLYLDKPYDLKYPSQTVMRTKRLQETGLQLHKQLLTGNGIDKRQLFKVYISQFEATVADFPQFDRSIVTHETYWRLAPT